jgi:hypothetical protein
MLTMHNMTTGMIPVIIPAESNLKYPNRIFDKTERKRFRQVKISKIKLEINICLKAKKFQVTFLFLVYK